VPDSVVDCRSTAAHKLLDLFGGEEGWDVIHAMLLNFFKVAAKKWPLKRCLAAIWRVRISQPEDIGV
jgi:hypothetical protein